MEKKPFLIAMEDNEHKKLKKYARESGLTLGDAIGLLVHHAEARVDLAKQENDLPGMDQIDRSFKGNLLFWVFLFSMEDEGARTYAADVGKKWMKKMRIPYVSIARQLGITA